MSKKRKLTQRAKVIRNQKMIREAFNNAGHRKSNRARHYN